MLLDNGWTTIKYGLPSNHVSPSLKKNTAQIYILNSQFIHQHLCVLQLVRNLRGSCHTGFVV